MVSPNHPDTAVIALSYAIIPFKAGQRHQTAGYDCMQDHAASQECLKMCAAEACCLMAT